MKHSIFIRFTSAFLLFLFSTNILFAVPPYKKQLNLQGSIQEPPCSTTNFYDQNTAFTMFGDSRSDLVNSPIYGFASLDAYFRATDWNVQNFGESGLESEGLRNIIWTCFARDNDPTKPKNPAFQTSYNIGFEIGGNDFLANYLLLMIVPTLISTRVPQARDNINSVIYLLQQRQKNVLLVGNFPAIS